MQGKAEFVGDLLALLQDFYRDKLASVGAHVAGSRGVTQYDFNNTYQYIINREETQLTWLSGAIIELGGVVPEDAAVQERKVSGRGTNYRPIIEADARDAQAFVEKWQPRVEAMTNARHRNMLRVILGETLEQKRFFEQALAGQTDLLGTRSEKAGARVGAVLPTRWIE